MISRCIDKASQIVRNIIDHSIYKTMADYYSFDEPNNTRKRKYFYIQHFRKTSTNSKLQYFQKFIPEYQNSQNNLKDALFKAAIKAQNLTSMVWYYFQLQ